MSHGNFEKRSFLYQGIKKTLYALKVNENRKKSEFTTEQEIKEYGNWFYEVTTDSKWNYSLRARDIEAKHVKNDFVVTKNTLQGKYPWTKDAAPITIKTKGRLLPRWVETNGSTGQVAYYVQHHDKPDDVEHEKELIPFGCTTLRITELPVRP